jgi:rod shape-determining protein MreD
LIKSDTLRYLFIGLGMVAVQVLLFKNLRIFDGEADLVLVYLIWLCTKQGKVESLILAGLLAFFQDAFTDLWGLNMFSKTVVVFILHSYLNRISENRFIFWQVFLILLAVAFLHNLIFFALTMFSETFASGYVFWSLAVVSTLMTAVIGGFLHLVRTDRV